MLANVCFAHISIDVCNIAYAVSGDSYQQVMWLYASSVSFNSWWWEHKLTAIKVKLPGPDVLTANE